MPFQYTTPQLSPPGELFSWRGLDVSVAGGNGYTEGMQPNDYDQPPAPVNNGLEPPQAPQPVHPAAPMPPEPEQLRPEPVPLPPAPAPSLPEAQGLPQSPEPTFLQDHQPVGTVNGGTPYDDEGKQPPSRKKRYIAVGAGLVVLLIAIGTLVALSNRRSETPGTDKSAQTPATDTTDNAAITSTNPQFFFSMLDPISHNPVITYVDAVTGKQRKQTLVLNDGYSADSPYIALNTQSADMNQPVQLTANGKVLAYASVREQVNGNEGIATTLDGSFSILAGSRTGTQQPILAGKNADQVLDWCLSTDGKVVYWLEGPGGKSQEIEATLYSINVNTGQSKKLGAVQHDPSRSHSKLFAVGRDNSLRFYSAMEDGIYQTKYDAATGKIDYDIITNQGQYAFGSFGDLSPDGRHLIYQGNPAGARVVTYRIGVDNGEVQTIFDPADAGVAYTPTAWSEDSKKLVIVSGPYGPAGQQRPAFAYQLISYDIVTNQQSTLAETTAPGLPAATVPAGYGQPQWSPGKKYIAYTQGQELYFYDVTSGKASVRRATVGAEFGMSNSGRGWIRLDTADET
jgi:hypothetical protein